MLYELLYIIPPPFTEKDVLNIQKSVDEVIEGAEGKVVSEENLGNRKLAYPIKHIRRGFYILVNFEGEPGNIKKIEKKLKLMSELLRFLIVKIPAVSKTKVQKEEAEKKTEETENLDLKTLGEKIDKLLEI
ncbi:MAG: 30S ribosomal protein S6 [Patescibacteria group bacterium]